MKSGKQSNWFRLYSEFATDPKVQMMSEAFQRRYIMVLCMRCDRHGDGDVTLRDEEIAFQLRISSDEWAASKAEFVSRNLLNESNDVVAWDKRQYVSDSSAERTAAWRDRVKRRCDVTVTPPDTDTDTDKERRKPTPASVKPMRGVSDSGDGFERFWSVWPKRVGKQNAKREWQRLQPDMPLLPEIIAAVERIAADPDRWRKADKPWSFLPDPERWLKARRWEDERADALSAYSAAEIETMTAYNVALAEKGWPVAAATPYSADRAEAIRRFAGFGSKVGWVNAYFGWLAEKLTPLEGFGFDWVIAEATYLRAKEGNFAALREVA